MRNKIHLIWFILIFGILIVPVHTEAAMNFQLTAECQANQQVKLSMIMPNAKDLNTVVDGFEIYRLNAATGVYELLGNVEVVKRSYASYIDYEIWDTYVETGIMKAEYIDSTPHTESEICYYQVKSYNNIERFDPEVLDGGEIVEREYLETGEISVTISAKAPVITNAKRSGNDSAKLTWESDLSADGYLIYCVSNYDEDSNPVDVDYDDFSQYTLVETIGQNNVDNYIFTDLMNGVTYTYRMCSYKMINGQQVVSIMSDAKSVTMDYYSHSLESYSERVKRAFKSEKKRDNNFKTSAKAAKQMKLIKIKVWDFANGKNGKKVARTKYLTVNKRLAPSIKAMFEEIYTCGEKQVIHDIGCFSYRTGEHMYGMAIDINANENYMIDDGKILAGSFWKPKKSKYSIPLDCETVRIMARYGFSRGFWGDRKDYMHFSYFGT